MSLEKKFGTAEAIPAKVAGSVEITPLATTLTFADIAKRIVKKSIRSAVCIDDRFIEPYMSKEEIDLIEKDLKPNKDGSKVFLDDAIPKRLYKSFRQHGECDLDIYHFRSYEESWKPEYILNNKDLVVIDWELDINDGFESTLKIIKEVINSGKIPFIIVYTHKPKDDFIQIARELISNFNHFDVKQVDSTKTIFFDEFLSKVSSLGEGVNPSSDDIEIFWEKNEVVSLLNAFLVDPKLADTVCDSLIDLLSTEFGITNKVSAKRKLTSILKEIFKIDVSLCLEYLAYLIIGSKSSERYILNRILIDELGFKINNTIITIFSKPGLHNEASSVSPENVFNQFSNLISSYPHNFITLLSVEMRDRLKEDISKISVGNSMIDERAFFKHMDNYKSKEEFFDFLLKSWVNDLAEYNLNIKPDIFSIIDQYRRDNGLQIINRDQIIDSLALLGFKLSTIIIPNRLTKDSKIRFGDIFQVIDETDAARNKEFLLSLTPHCVCADSAKIDNNFYFIKNKPGIIKLTTAVNKIETDFYSFIKPAEELMPLEWDCKPFTLYFELNDLNDLRGTYKNKPIRLKYITTLKENFAQRISNKSFEYGTAIGIDLPH